MKQNITKIVTGTLSVAMILGSCMIASAEERDYPNKELWFKETDAFFWSDAKTAYEHNNMALEGFDMDAYVNSELGEGVINNMANYLTYSDQMDPELLAYWEEKGVKKELHDAEDEERVWASYTPLAAYEEENADKKWPIVFVLHGNDNPIFLAETYGFAQICADEGFIAVMPWADNDDIIEEEIVRIMEILKADYPIDESRVYCTGFSKGGMATMRLSLTMSDIFAAAAPGGAQIGGNPFDDTKGLLEKSIFEEAKYPVPLMQYVGLEDNNKQLPYDTEIKVTNINNWFEEVGIEKVDVLEENLERIESAENIVEQKIGLDFDDTEILNMDGTQYYVGNVYDTSGNNMLKIVAVEGQPHWPSPSIPTMVWEFFEQFSRDPQTGELIVSE